MTKELEDKVNKQRERVIHALYALAVGYSTDEKDYKPDKEAAKLWLQLHDMETTTNDKLNKARIEQVKKRTEFIGRDNDQMNLNDYDDDLNNYL